MTRPCSSDIGQCGATAGENRRKVDEYTQLDAIDCEQHDLEWQWRSNFFRHVAALADHLSQHPSFLENAAASHPVPAAFLALAILPRSVFGPHDRSHGFQLRMSAACRTSRSGVQPLLMAQPQ
jgi:hypothetical protein